MSTTSALLDTLLGAAELNGNRGMAQQIRAAMRKIDRPRAGDSYRRLARAVFEPRRLSRAA